ncbi:uncharacterized protein DS421_16g564450 [Arachis hypogaea]|nr:uncharacterized protein DS421_16g564450 [Arachis hypogaea]
MLRICLPTHWMTTMVSMRMRMLMKMLMPRRMLLTPDDADADAGLDRFRLLSCPSNDHPLWHDIANGTNYTSKILPSPMLKICLPTHWMTMMVSMCMRMLMLLMLMRMRMLLMMLMLMRMRVWMRSPK